MRFCTPDSYLHSGTNKTSEPESSECSILRPDLGFVPRYNTRFPTDGGRTASFGPPISDLRSGAETIFERGSSQCVCVCVCVCFSTPIATLYWGANNTFKQRLSDSSILSPVRRLLARYRLHFPTGFFQLQCLGAHSRICTRVQSCTFHTQAGQLFVLGSTTVVPRTYTQGSVCTVGQSQPS